MMAQNSEHNQNDTSMDDGLSDMDLGWFLEFHCQNDASDAAASAEDSEARPPADVYWPDFSGVDMSC